MNPKLYRYMKLASRRRIEDISIENLKKVLATTTTHRVDFEKKHVNKITCVFIKNNENLFYKK